MGEVKSLTASIFKFRERRHAKSSVAAAKSANLLLLLIWCALPASSYGRGARQQQAKEPLGSLSNVGEVFVNDSAAPAESTVFVGDRVRTGETGSAAFTISGKGTLKISPQSQLTFAGNYQYTAELEAGTVIVSSIAGPNGMILRIGNFVVLSSFRQQPAISKITRAPDGSFVVSCLDGSVGVLTADSKSGEFLQAGQSLTISSKAEFLPSPPSVKQPGNFHTGWLLLGLAGAGAAAATAQLAHGGKQSISPSTP